MDGCQLTGALRISGLTNSKFGMGFILRDRNSRILIGRIQKLGKYSSPTEWVNFDVNSKTSNVWFDNIRASMYSSALVGNGYHSMKNTGTYWGNARHKEMCSMRQNGQCIIDDMECLSGTYCNN